MNSDLEWALEIVAEWALEHNVPAAHRLDVWIKPEHTAATARALVDARWGYLTAITGLDRLAEDGQLEALYHYCRGASILTLRASVPRDHAVVPSVCDAIPMATVYERELAEMFGVTIVGTPDSSRLFLPDDWPDGVYPLRKDAVLESAAPARKED
ncbi:MAG: NADH-quinone oxidoreductase subunit C [Aggregatilineales bacterium]